MITEINVRLTPTRGSVKAIASCRYHDLFLRGLLVVAEPWGLTVRFPLIPNAGENVTERAWLTTMAQAAFESAILAAYRQEAATYA